MRLDWALACRYAGWELSVLLVAAPELVADRPGAYSFELALDGRHAKSIPILVSAA